MDITREHLLQLYDEIEEADHSYRVRFYESNTALIFSLDEVQQHYFHFYYICSLFELGKYEHVLTEIDQLIEFVFIRDVHFRPVGTFEELLFKKASSLHNTLQFDKSLAVSEQLIRMHPDEVLYQSLAGRSYRAQFNRNSSGVRLTSLVLIFGSAIISAIVWLLNARYVGKSVYITFLVVISPCILALGLLGLSQLYSYLRSQWKIHELIQDKKSSIQENNI